MSATVGAAVRFRPGGQGDLAPAGQKAKARANLDALAVLNQLDSERRPATAGEQTVLARWSGWGAIPNIFDGRDTAWASERNELRGLVDETAWVAARRTTLNAHYTDAAVARIMWDGVERLGFRGGTVIEPGCGAGTFLGLVPDPTVTRCTGVELDPTTGRIARALYPDATIRIEGFETTRLPRRSFDLAIGNVPFGDFRLVDPSGNPGRHSIHNHFIIKSLDLVRPNGLVCLVTSRFTLDATNPAARTDIANRAVLLGAVRLPAGAFRGSAGTDAICDILILQRHPDTPEAVTDQSGTVQSGPDRGGVGESPDDGLGWLQAVDVALPGGTVQVNQWFVDHPELVAGDMAVGRGQYRDEDLVVTRTPDFQDRLTVAVDRIVTQAIVDGRTHHPQPEESGAVRSGSRDQPTVIVNTPDVDVAAATTPTGAPVAVTGAGEVGLGWKEGSIHRNPAGAGFVTVTSGAVTAYTPKAGKDAGELGALVDLRDTTVALLDMQASSTTDTDFAVLQNELNRVYDGYVDRYGPLNRFRLARTGRTDPATGVDRMRRLRPVMGGFRTDPDAPTVLALERFDDETGAATKATIFTRRVVAPRTRVTTATDPGSALAVSLDETGTPNLGRIAELLAVTEDQARVVLGDLVWDDPTTGELIEAPRFLAGNVRQKLVEARAAAAVDSRFNGHVTALAAVMPDDLTAGQIDARLGATWIPATDIEQFVGEVLDAPSIGVYYDRAISQWSAHVPTAARGSVAMTSVWGTDRRPAIDLLVAAANQTPVTVYDTITDNGADRRVVNVDATLDARAKQEQLGERFATWVWEDDTRTERLTGRYNELFNSTVPQRWDGTHLSLPGLVDGFTPHEHQYNAVWRIISQPTVLLAHEVGAGKTASMVIGVMELGRLGLVSKPAVVVPNHMLEQFTREAKQLYPRANLLVAGAEDVTAANRKHFAARCATGDWDAVIITHSAFERLPVSPAAQAQFLSDEVAELRAALEAVDGDRRGTVKAIEKAIVRRETRITELLSPDRKDDGVTFESTGLDYLAVDEAHLFKNLSTVTRIPGLATEGSKRAEDLHLKLSVLRARNGPRVATLATATPVANSIAELHVMQRYLQPDTLTATGVTSFDAWAANFARTVTALELGPDGASYRMTSRIARFANVTDLTAMFAQVADVQTAADLNLKVPGLVGGKPETVIVNRTPTLDGYVADLVVRAEAIRGRKVTPDVDNMLKVTGDGRKAALDLRLVGLDPEHPTKAATIAARVAQIHHADTPTVYQDPATGTPSPRTGGLQIVFCDAGTPKPAGGWSVYAELRDEMVARGVPAEQIRFIHDAKNDQQKADLFAACRDGRVRVIVGSTEKMGVGTNIQNRALALHHADCPWRPADLAQRDGRLIRQGNQNRSVHVIRYATEASFDVYCWQTVERKAGFIAQITTGRNTGLGVGGGGVREVEDVGDATLSFAEVKALASGNPLIIEHANVTEQLTRTQRAADAHQADQARLLRAVTRADGRMQTLTARITQVETAIGTRVDTTGDRFTITVNGTTHRVRRDAGVHLQTELGRHLRTHGSGPVLVGTLAGFALHAESTRGPTPHVTITIPDTPIRVIIDETVIRTGDPVGLIRRLETPIHNLNHTDADTKLELDRITGERHAANARIGAPFPHTDTLRDLRARHEQLTVQIAEQVNPIPTDPNPSHGDPNPTDAEAQGEPGVTDVGSIDNPEVIDLTEPQAPRGAGGAVPGTRTSTPDHHPAPALPHQPVTEPGYGR